MMNETFFLSLLSGFGIVYFTLGFFISRKVKTTDDYFLAGSNLGLIPVTFSLIATQLGSGTILGTSDFAYNFGYFSLLYAIGMSTGFLLLASGFAARLRSLNVATTAELFETRYGSPGLKKFASLLSIATLFGILLGQIIASKTLIVGLGVYNEYIFLLFWAFIIAYTIIGGLQAVAIVDTLQVIFIIIIFGGIFLYGLSTEQPAFLNITNLKNVQDYFKAPNLTFAKLLPIALMPACYSLIEQDLAQRFFAARTKRIAAISAIGAGTFMILFTFIPMYLGMKARLFGIAIPAGATPIVPVLRILTNDTTAILAVCGIIAAISSTADSLLCAISSNVAQDFDLSFMKIKNKLVISKLTTLIVGVSALGVSYYITKNIIDILIVSYEISVSCLLVPLLFCYFNPQVKKKAALYSVIFGLIGFVLFRYYPVPIPKEVATLLLSLLGYILGAGIKVKIGE